MDFISQLPPQPERSTKAGLGTAHSLDFASLDSNIAEFYGSQAYGLSGDASLSHSRDDEDDDSTHPSKALKSGDSGDDSLPAQAPARKAGRKPDTREPESKRRAQNRAAQRAFRERKERHLKDLETRVMELEKESRGWQNTSMALRSKLSALEDELGHYRGGPVGSPAASTASGHSSNFTFSYPMSTAPGSTAGSVAGSTPRFPLTPGSDRAELFKTATAQSAANSFSPGAFFSGVVPQSGRESIPQKHSPESMPSLSSDGTPSSGPGSTGPIDPPTVGSTDSSDKSPDADEFCDQLSLACPIRPGKNTGPSKLADKEVTIKSTEPFDISFGYREPTSNLEDDPLDLPELINNDYSLFDPLEDILNWPTAPDAVADPEHSGPYSRVPASLFDPENATGMGQPEDVSSGTSTSLPAGAAKSDDDEVVPAGEKKLINCFEVWDRICAHPKFGELDINSMCTELRAKAKCSDTGVVLPENELDTILQSYH